MVVMSYSGRRRRALGQVFVPGQVNFMTSRHGHVPLIQQFAEGYGPMPGYVEHGSYVTSEPDIVRFGYDPYRGIMGLGQLTEFACDQTAAAAVYRQTMTAALSAGGKAALVGGAFAGVIGVVTKRAWLAALGGAGAAWASHAIWTTTYRP
jgi:hypothetical protein